MFNLEDVKRIQAVRTQDPKTHFVVLCTEFVTKNTFNSFDLAPAAITRGLRQVAAAVPANWNQRVAASNPDMAFALKPRFWKLTGGQFHRATRVYDEWRKRYDFFQSTMPCVDPVSCWAMCGSHPLGQVKTANQLGVLQTPQTPCQVCPG